LVEGIEYGLFGADNRTKADILSDGSVGQVVVSLALEIDSNQVVIQRKGSEAELSVNGAPEVRLGPRSDSQVTKEVCKLLGGLSRDQFESTYIAK
jgi:hypothetical protein